jgi:hypothetical protein
MEDDKINLEKIGIVLKGAGYTVVDGCYRLPAWKIKLQRFSERQQRKLDVDFHHLQTQRRLDYS